MMFKLCIWSVLLLNSVVIPTSELSDNATPQYIIFKNNINDANLHNSTIVVYFG